MPKNTFLNTLQALAAFGNKTDFNYPAYIAALRMQAGLNTTVNYAFAIWLHEDRETAAKAHEAKLKFVRGLTELGYLVDLTKSGLAVLFEADGETPRVVVQVTYNVQSPEYSYRGEKLSETSESYTVAIIGGFDDVAEFSSHPRLKDLEKVSPKRKEN